MKKFLLILSLLFFMATAQSNAQCAMCKRSAETSFKQGDNKMAISNAKSLNHGILYLLSIPYLIGAVGAFAWYKTKKKA